MAAAKATLFSVRSKVLQFRNGISPSLVDKFINDRVRELMDSRNYWSDLVLKGVLAVPDAWRAGTVSVAPGSPLVTGTGTGWPVNDLTNTIIRDGIFETGNQEVFPAVMDGITEDSILLVDAESGPPVQEIVAVNQVTPNSFWAVFMNSHNQDCTVQQSSLRNRQFRMGANNPIFDVLAVLDPQTLVINQPWGGLATFNQQYNIPQMYYPIVPNVRMFRSVVDRQQGIPILTNVQIDNINWQDPQRTASGDPEVFADLGASRNGLSLYELWPCQLNARQIDWILYVDWPELVNDTDRLPWFINPAVFENGAIADALRYRNGKEDYLHNPVMARDYEAKFKEGMEKAINADESKMQADYSGPSPLGIGGGPGTLYNQSHTGNGWGSDWASELW